MPRPKIPPRTKTLESTELGTLCHWWKETGETEPYWARTADVRTLEKKITQSGIDRDRWWPNGTGMHEVTFAINPFDRRIELYTGPRELADRWKALFRLFRGRWLTGTIDWLGHNGRRWHVDDLKTGAWPVSVKLSKQLRSYSLVPWMIEGCPAVWECDVSITQWPRYPLGDEPTRTWDVVSGLELEDHLADIRWAIEHPNSVVVAPFEEYEASGKLHPCSGCEAREAFPASEWMQSFFYRTLPHCAAGLVKRVYQDNGAALHGGN